LKFLWYAIGFLAVLVVLLVLVTSIAHNSFNQKVKAEVEELFREQGESRGGAVTAADLQNLPPVVAKWMSNSGVVGKERPSVVRLRQSGEMRTTPEQAWTPFTADSYYTVQEPGFIWHADVKMAPLVHLAGRDKLHQGHGHMLIKLLSLITVADGRGKEIDQGSLVRYLAEIAYFPAAALSDFVTWEAVSDDSAKATISVKGTTASGTFVFDAQGNPVEFTAPRYMEKNGQYSMEAWKVLMRDHREFDGIVLPAEVEVIWDLSSGGFKWYQAELTEVEYNQPEFY
jgi:hypothetical protein